MARFVGGTPTGGYDTSSIDRMKGGGGGGALTPWTPDPSLGHLLYTMRRVGPKIPTEDPDLVITVTIRLSMNYVTLGGNP